MKKVVTFLSVIILAVGLMTFGAGCAECNLCGKKTCAKPNACKTDKCKKCGHSASACTCQKTCPK